MNASAWTDARIARLKTLWLEGRSAGQIALELGKDISRSAVLGKVHRLGLSTRRALPARTYARPAETDPKRARPVLGPEARSVASPVTRDRGMPAEASQGQAAATAPPPPPTVHHTLLTLGAGQCRWPYGDPRTGVFFCGRPVARGAFCAGHAEAGYRAPAGGAASLMALAGLA